ncbi:Coenzyme F420 hydrogenase/dehydrogenase, beta subunit C-terminal domain, partial [Treponema pedis]|uniref:Coenzyme F420 hydrogenase/dehydrogenase, beta subunit C-terminal domain n=1 Tax=Treponema pedis TaxID=409322 RepID=UPI0004650755
WGQYIEEIVLKNGKYVYSDWFVNIFFNDSSLRECCYKCPYTSPVSNADVTIGDFWGIDRCIPDMYNKYGVSAVIIHSEKGRFLFDKVKNCSFYKEVKKADLVTPQPMLYSAVVKPKRYNLFWKNYFDEEFKIFLRRESFNSLTKINIIKLCLYKL